MASLYQRHSSPAMPTSTVELSVQCKKLSDRDLMSKSDPMCVLFAFDERGQWVEVDRTETVKNSLNPVWEKKFIMEYR